MYNFFSNKKFLFFINVTQTYHFFLDKQRLHLNFIFLNKLMTNHRLVIYFPIQSITLFLLILYS